MIAAPSTVGAVDVGRRQLLAGGEVGVHRALAVRRDQDHRARRRRAVGQRRGREMDAERLHVVAEELSELVVGDLADEGGAPAEGGDARRGVAGAAAGDELRRAHVAEEPVGLRAVDQPHRALHQAFANQKILFRMRQHVDDRVADRQHVELRLGHPDPASETTRPPSGSGGGLANRAMRCEPCRHRGHPDFHGIVGPGSSSGMTTIGGAP